VTAPLDRRDRRRRRRRTTAVRWSLRLLAAAIVFGLGVALGAALHDNPKPTGPSTYTRTFAPSSP
jgi:anti-sigma factor RsiW